MQAKIVKKKDTYIILYNLDLHFNGYRKYGKKEFTPLRFRAFTFFTLFSKKFIASDHPGHC